MPNLHVSPLDVLSFLLHNPPVTLAAAFGIAYLLPRLTRALLKFLVLPIAILLLAAVVVENPKAVSGAVTGLFSVVSQHPVEVSSVILLGTALFLSPYLLAGVVVLLLVTGVPRLPAMLRPALPAPVVEVQARLADARERVVGPLAAASERLRHIGAPAAPSPGSPALPRPNPSSSGALSATQPLTGLPAEDTSDSWFSSALRPLRSLLSAAASSPDSETKPSGMSSGAQQQGSLQSEQTADSWLGSALWSLRSLAAPAPPDPGRAALQSPSSPAAPSSKPGQAGQQAAAAGSSSSSPFSRFGGALQPLRGLVGLSERRGEPQAAAGGGPPVEQPAGGAVTEDGSWLGGRLRPLRQAQESVTGSVRSLQESASGFQASAGRVQQQAASGVRAAGDIVRTVAGRVGEATACRREVLPEARARCVAEQNVKRGS